MSESEFVAQESRKMQSKQDRALDHVRKTGQCFSRWEDTFLMNDMIQLCPPDESNEYNHYKVNESVVTWLKDRERSAVLLFEERERNLSQV